MLTLGVAAGLDERYFDVLALPGPHTRDTGEPAFEYPSSSAAPRLAAHASAGSGESNSSRSPLQSMNMGFIKAIAEKRITRADGQAPKKRGPKPDSKPALTRRQELNRQAQRTHRERKELYIKALEQEVLRLKDALFHSDGEKVSMAQEIHALKQLLHQQGMPIPESLGSQSAYGNSPGEFGGNSSTASGSGSMGGSTQVGSATSSSRPDPPSGKLSALTPPSHAHILPPPAVDSDQVGIDFVLTLERPCREHMPFLVERAQQSDGDISGHAFMVSCPPEARIHDLGEAAFDPNPPELKHQLHTLLETSRRLDLDGEITPVMAWAMVVEHPRAPEITVDDVTVLKEDLKTKVRCYGFGAVLEEFEVRDTLQSIFASKTEAYRSIEI